MIDATGKKILLVRNDNLGDLVCTTPAIEALRKKYPNNQIDIVVNSYNYSAIYKNPFVDKIYCYTKPKHKKKISEKIKAALGKLKILWQIKKENYDIVIVFRSGYSKSAELFSNITNAKYKIGVKNKKGNDNFNIYVPFHSNMHEVEFCFECVKALNVFHNEEKTIYFLDNKKTDNFKSYNDIVLFHISARMKNNKMSLKKLKTVFDNINIDFYITAEPQDIEMAKELSRKKNIKYIPTSSMDDLAQVISKSRMFITLEGGAMHIAPALGVKTIALFGVSNINRWHPWGYKDLVLQHDSHIAEDIDNSKIAKKILENI